MKSVIMGMGIVSTLFIAMPASAGGSLQHFGQSLEHSAQAVANGTVGSLKVISAAASLPLMAAGEVGKVSGELGEELWEEANTPLPISDEVVTAGPRPEQAMQEPEKQ